MVKKMENDEMKTRNSKRVNNAEDIYIHTIIDNEESYPIYITPPPQCEIWLKKKPASIALSFHVTVNRRLDHSKSFHSKETFEEAAAAFSISIDERVRAASAALLELGNIDRHLSVYDVTYEVYAGDFEKLLSTINTVVVKLTAESKFRCTEKQAWAISFEWEKRIKAKHPMLAKYTYPKAIIGRRNYARVVIKIPFASRELDDILAKSLQSAVSEAVSELEEIRVLEEQIKIKEQELQMLKEQLLKLQLEQMKKAVT